MSLDYYDKRDLKDAIDAAQKKTSRETQEMFNRLAKAIENLAGEVKQLRADLNPELDKPKKLAAPAAPQVSTGA